MQRRKNVILEKIAVNVLCLEVGKAYGEKRRANPTGKTSKEHGKKYRQTQFVEVLRKF
jgi:hypothetical protein